MARGRIETNHAPVPGERILRNGWRPIMDQRIVQTPTKARQGSKSGVVRYVLAISTLLVVIAFAVAYTLSV
jgi:hypothetical protein